MVSSWGAGAAGVFGSLMNSIPASISLITPEAPPVLAADQEATSSSSCTRDAYGKCVPAGCASYFDGCNTCNVGAVLGCTMMFCDTPQEPKCLAYIGETEKN